MDKKDILVIYGQDHIEMAKEICKNANLKDMIEKTTAKIALKPNLVVPRDADDGATTHLSVVEGVLQYLQENGFRDITIMEGSWVGARTEEAFRRCGYKKLAEKYDVRICDTQKDSYKTYDCAGMKIQICDQAMGVDFMINMPVMKGHCQTKITCALKNNKGIIPDKEKRNFHSIGLHKPIAHLNTKCKNDFILVDAICGDLDFEEGGNPVVGNRLFAACDPVLCDAYAAQQMGYDVSEVAYIKIAEALGVGNADVSSANIKWLNDASQGGKSHVASGKVRRLAVHAKEDNACSACYAAVIRALSRMSGQEIQALKSPICVGQGWQGKQGVWGVGKCCKEFSHTCAGCPPSANDIVEMIRRENI